MSWRKDKGGLGPESGLGLRPKARAKARAGAVPKLSPSRAHHPDGSVARTLPARATTPTRTPSASVRTASARSTRCGRPTASLPLCAPPPVAALSAAAHTHTVPLITRPPLMRRIRGQPKTRHRAQSTRSQTASASRSAGPPPRHTRCHSQAPQPPLRPHSCHSPIAAAHPPPHPTRRSNRTSPADGRASLARASAKQPRGSWCAAKYP